MSSPSQQLPESALLKRLTPLERSEVQRLYVRTLAEQRHQSSDNEPTANAVHRAFILGVATAIMRVAVPVALLLAFADAVWLHMRVLPGLAVLGALVVLGGGVYGARVLQVRRYFASSPSQPVHPEESRSVGEVAGSEREASPLRPNAASTVSLVAPDLWPRLSSLERFLAPKFYRKLLIETPDQQLTNDGALRNAATVRQALLNSVRLIAVLAGILPFMAFDYAIGPALHGVTGGVITASVAGAILIMIIALALLRRAEIRRYFGRRA